MIKKKDTQTTTPSIQVYPLTIAHMAATIQSSGYQHHNNYYESRGTIGSFGRTSNGWSVGPAANQSTSGHSVDAFATLKQVNANGGTTAAISSTFGSTGYGNNSNMMRTDVFPFLSLADDCSPSAHTSVTSMVSSSSLSSPLSPSSFLYHSGGTTQIGASTTGTTGLDLSDTNDSHLDYSSSFAAPIEWSTTTSTTSAANNNTTGIELPSSLTMHREDSLIGKSIGFEAFSSEIDAAPAPTPSSSVKTPGQSPQLFGTTVPYAFDVAPASAASPSVASAAAMNDFGSLNFDFTFPGLGDIIGAIPTTVQQTSTSVVSSGASVGSADSDMEPDASSITDVDAVSDAWSVSSGPASPMYPHSPITRMTRSPMMTSSVASAAAIGAMSNPNATLALRPGPYTRGRAAALAAPSAPRELKPVPVARGPHAGLLGGGEMATVGIYTKDDRWRKIERLREKRRARIVVKSSGGQYACRKSFADRRPRIGGRFVKMDDETKRYLSLTKPGVTAPANIAPPPALRAYAAVQATQHVGDNVDEYHSQLAVAAHAASQSTATMPLFGHSIATLPPAPSWPAAAVNTTSQWYNYPNIPSPTLVSA